MSQNHLLFIVQLDLRLRNLHVRVKKQIAIQTISAYSVLSMPFVTTKGNLFAKRALNLFMEVASRI